MNTISITTKFLLPIVSIFLLGTYGVVIGGHIFLEAAYRDFNLKTDKRVINNVFGAKFIENEHFIYCLDKVSEGVYSYPQHRYPEYPVSDCVSRARRITIQSRYLEKSWQIFLNEEDEVVFKYIP